MSTPDFGPPSPTVLGLRARRGPHHDLSLPLEPGLTALYGLNGAGKTWVLRILRECADGLMPAQWNDEYAQLLVEAPQASSLYAWIVDHLGGEAAARRAMDDRYWALEDPLDIRAKEHQRRHDEQALAEAIASALSDPRAPFAIGSPLIGRLEYSEAADLIAEPFVAELSRSTTFALVPSGHLRREWEVWLCAPAGDDQGPAMKAVLQAARAQLADALDAVRELNELDVPQEEFDARMIAVDDQWRAVVRHPLFSWAWHHHYDNPSEAFSGESNPLWGHLRDGLPIPIAKLCVLRDSKPLAVLDERTDDDLEVLTARRLSQATRSAKEELSPEQSVTVTEEMRSWLARTEQEANRVLKALLRAAPALTLTLLPPREWLEDKPVAWRAGRLRIDELSRAEARWAAFAIRWVLSSERALVMLDEPEAALHRSAEEHMARGLSEISLEAPRMLAATHSPFLLDDPTTAVVEVSRQAHAERDGIATHRHGDPRGFATARVMNRLQREDLGRLGLKPSDLLRRTRVFVLVEGEHDDVVIRHACASQLDEGRAELVAVRGSGKLARSLDSEVLFDFTDAHLVAVLDNIDVEEAEDAWAEARAVAASGTLEKAIDQLNARWQGRSDEFQAMRAWLSRALKRGVDARLTPLGLAARDIIEYLPVELIVPGCQRTWSELRAEHDAATPALGRELRDFKRWLAATYGREMSVAAVAAAAQALGVTHPVHPDLLRLGQRIRAIGYEQAG